MLINQYLSARSHRPIVGMVRMNFIMLSHDAGSVATRLIMPVVLMIVLRPLYIAALRQGGQSGSRQVITGMAIMFSLLAVALVGSSILEEHTQHTWDRLRATSARPTEILLSKAIPAGSFFVIQQLLVVVGGCLVFGVGLEHWGLLFCALLAWVLTVLCMGLALGTMVRSFGQLFAVQDIGGFLLTTLGGALVPIAILPSWVQMIAPISPGYWGVMALQSALTGDENATFLSVAVLAGIAGAFGALTYIRTWRSWKNPLRL
jgi:ABC-2 type transport system permease protein